MAISENKRYPRTGDTQTVYLKHVITGTGIQVGDYTMYNDFVHDPQDFEKNKSKVPVYQRKPYDAFPFDLSVSDFFEEWGLDVKDITRAWDNKGDIVVGNDVWIGFEAVILSGVTIGDGAIIGTRAVVTKDVAPYTVVGGVPAKFIRKRFSDEVILELLKLQWWNWSESRIKQNIDAIQSGCIEDLK